MRVRTIDVGGTNVKVLSTGQSIPRKAPSGPTMPPREIVAAVKALAGRQGQGRGKQFPWA
jgi:polyphosphate glucokinase